MKRNKTQDRFGGLKSRDMFKKPYAKKLADTGSDSNTITRIFDKIIGLSLFMVFLGIPLFFTGVTFQGVVFEKQIYFYFWVLLALVLWVSKGVILGEMKIRKTPVDVMLLVFWFICLISMIFSVDRWHSFWGFFGDPSRGFMNLTAMMAFYYIFMSNLTAKRMQMAFSGLVISSVVVSLWTAVAIFDVKFITEKLHMVPLSLIGTMAGLKLFIGVSIPLLITAAIKINEKGYSRILGNILKGLVFLATVLNVVILSALYDKILLWIVLVGVGFLLIYILSGVVSIKKGVAWVPMSAFLLIIVAIMIESSNGMAKIDIPVEVAPNASLSWEIVKGGLKDNLFLGSGPATYGYDFSMYRPESFNVNSFYNFRFYQGTGLFFELIPTVGALGAVSFIVLALSFLSVSLYLVSTAKKDKSKTYSLGLISSMIILIPAIFLARVEGSILIIGALLASLTVAVLFLEIGFGKEQISLSLKASPKYALALAFIFIVISASVAVLFVSIGKIYVADLYAGKSAVAKGSSEASVEGIVKAYSLNRREGRYFLRASQEYVSLVNLEISSGQGDQSLEKIESYINRSVELAKEGVRLMPNDVLAYSVLGQVYEVAGKYSSDAVDLTKDSYEKALSLEPNNPLFLVKIGQSKLSLASRQDDEAVRKGLIENAQKDFEEALKKKSDFAMGYYNLSITNEALGDNDGAVAATIQAINLDNSNINYLFNLARLYQVRGEDKDNKNAEQVYKYILAVNPNEINTNFSLGVLYEKMKDTQNALKYYEKVSDLISTTGNDKLKEQVDEMIDNLESGKGNLNNIEDAQTVTENESVEIDESDMITPDQAQEIIVDDSAETVPDVEVVPDTTDGEVSD
ncbi:hypothetical protein ACFL08_03325 [Patescibacteria group bacterium]